MESASLEVAGQINTAAQKNLERSAPGLAYISKEQGGINLEDEDAKLSPETNARVTNLLGLSAITGDLRHSLFEQSASHELTDTSNKSPEPVSMQNQDLFVEGLLGEMPTLIDKLAEINAKARIFDSIVKDRQRDETLEGLRIRIDTWKETVDGIALSLCADDAEKARYQQLVDSNVAEYQETPPGKEAGDETTKPPESYSQRLARLVENPRAVGFITARLKPEQGGKLAEEVIDEYLETAFTFNAVRVLDRIERPLGISGEFDKLTACLRGVEQDPKYTDIINNNHLTSLYADLQQSLAEVYQSNLSVAEKSREARDLNAAFEANCQSILSDNLSGVENEEVISLVDTKETLLDIKRQTEEIKASDMPQPEKDTRLAELDRQIQELMIPIANKIERIFPHKESTNLTDVLENEDAICAGKVNVLLAVSKYLGLNARANTVLEILDNNTQGHVCCECDLPSGNKLVIDANFGNISFLDGKTDDEIIAYIKQTNPEIKAGELDKILKSYKLSIANAASIPQESRVLMYTASNTTELAHNDDSMQTTKDQPELFVRINPDTGHKEIWRASIPYPHLITSPDKDGNLFMNSSFAFNNHFANKEVSAYLLQKHIEMNPYNSRAYELLLGMLPPEDGIALLEKTLKEKPDFYWDRLSTEHAVIYAKNGNLDMAVQISEETKTQNPVAYYTRIHELGAQIRKQADKTGGESAESIRARAVGIMEQARRENPKLFFSAYPNVAELANEYGDQNENIITLYEEYKANQDAFWDTSQSNALNKLMTLYLERAKQDPAKQDTVLQLAGEMKSRNPEYYARNVCNFAQELYLVDAPKDQPQAISMLEDARADLSGLFFRNAENVTTLGRLYKRQDMIANAIALYEESQTANPEAFWNDSHGPIYTELVRLYLNAGQTDNALSLFEEARDKNTNFWGDKFSANYTGLVDLYVKTGHLTEALTASLEAQTKDPNFFNPDHSNEGYLQLALLYDQNGQADKAIETMLRGQDTDETFWATNYPHVMRLIDYYEESEQLSEATKALERLRETQPDFWRTDYYRICKIYEDSGETEKAGQIRQELIGIYEGLKTTDLDDYYYVAEKLGNLYLQQGDTEKAIEVFNEGKANYDYFSIRGIALLGDLYSGIGETEKATGNYQDAIDRAKEIRRDDLVLTIIEKAKDHGIELAV